MPQAKIGSLLRRKPCVDSGFGTVCRTWYFSGPDTFEEPFDTSHAWIVGDRCQKQILQHTVRCAIGKDEYPDGRVVSLGDGQVIGNGKSVFGEIITNAVEGSLHVVVCVAGDSQGDDVMKAGTLRERFEVSGQPILSVVGFHLDIVDPKEFQQCPETLYLVVALTDQQPGF